MAAFNANAILAQQSQCSSHLVQSLPSEEFAKLRASAHADDEEHSMSLECSLPIKLLRKSGESFADQMARNVDDPAKPQQDRKNNALRAVSIDAACRDYLMLKKQGKLSKWLKAVVLLTASNKDVHNAALVKNEAVEASAFGRTNNVETARRAWMLCELRDHVNKLMAKRPASPGN